MSIDKFDCFDINFFNNSTTNTHHVWKLINSVVSLWSHIVLYLCASILMGLLIWRSILLISSTYMGNVVKAANSKQMMDDWVKAIVLITGLFVIMPALIYFYKNLEQLILNGNNRVYLIRANVENVYQFNTSFTGYVKYMALTSDHISAFGFSLFYLIVELLNFVWFIVMFIRVLMLAFLTIVSPITSINTMTKKIPNNGFISRNLHFKNWIKTYVLWTFLPLIVIIVHRIMLMIV